MEAFALKRAPDPSSGPFPALCAAEGPLPRREPLLTHSGANTARQAGKRRLEGAGGREAAPAGCCLPGKNGPASRIIPKPAQALPAQIPPESRSNRGKTPPACIRKTLRQDAQHTRSAVRNRPSRGAERRFTGG